MTAFYFIDYGTTRGKYTNISSGEGRRVSGEGKEVKVYALSATTNIRVSSNAVVSTHPVEDGSTITDNYFVDNKTATFDGIITDIQVISKDDNFRDAREDQGVPTNDSNSIKNSSRWIADIQNIREGKRLVTLVAHTEVIPNCVITSLNISKTKVEGLTGWKCSLSFKEVVVSERAKRVSIKEPHIEVKDDVAPKTKSGKTAQQEVPLGLTVSASLIKD